MREFPKKGWLNIGARKIERVTIPISEYRDLLIKVTRLEALLQKSQENLTIRTAEYARALCENERIRKEVSNRDECVSPDLRQALKSCETPCKEGGLV